ncbi:MAG: hypothetical protein WCV90_00380 [Candidatus Woesearchaeota archaeon]|jgi:hypothetical protein
MLTAWTHQDDERELCYKLGIEDISQVKEERIIPASQLEKALNEFRAGETNYDAILLDHSGKLTYTQFFNHYHYRFDSVKITRPEDRPNWIRYELAQQNDGKTDITVFSPHFSLKKGIIPVTFSPEARERLGVQAARILNRNETSVTLTGSRWFLGYKVELKMRSSLDLEDYFFRGYALNNNS